MITIKKYKNRRLYNQNQSCYVRAKDIEKMIDEGMELQILSHPEGENITKEFLLEAVLQQTRFLEFVPEEWLRSLFQRRGTSEEEPFLQLLSRILLQEEDSEEERVSDEIVYEAFSSEESSEDVIEMKKEESALQKEAMEISLKPEDLLEIGWEEDSNTEEVEETQISIVNVHEDVEKTVERIEPVEKQKEETLEAKKQHAEKTVERIELPKKEEAVIKDSELKPASHQNLRDKLAQLQAKFGKK